MILKKLLFKGEYLKSKSRGKGKEYHYEKLIFEGEYLSVKRNRKGNEYQYDKYLKFEGEYTNEEKK